MRDHDNNTKHINEVIETEENVNVTGTGINNQKNYIRNKSHNMIQRVNSTGN